MAKKVINFNTITEKELEQLPGIGRSKATAIIQQRLLHSTYKSVSDLISVEGISKTLILKLLEDYSFEFTKLDSSSKRRHGSAPATYSSQHSNHKKRQLRKDSQSSSTSSESDAPNCSPCKKARNQCDTGGGGGRCSSGCLNTSFCRHGNSTNRNDECNNHSVENNNRTISKSGDEDELESLGRTPASPSSEVVDLGKPPLGLSSWLDQFEQWSREERLSALNNLISGCDMSVVRHMMTKIEPHFQRDFIALLPKELALYVLSFLDPKDLCQAAKTCRYWRILTEDNLLWREKCREYDVFCPIGDRLSINAKPGEETKPYKHSFLYCHKLEMNWRSRDLRPAKYLRGHDDHVVTCLEFDGERIVSGSDDNTLKVWSAVTGNLIRTLVGHTGGVWSSHLKGNIVVSGSTDRTLRVWNADSGECSFVLQGHTSTVRCLAMHENSIVSGSRDGTLRVWDVTNGNCLHVLIGHAASVRCVQFDGKRVVSGAYDYLVKIWDVETESCLHTLSGHSNRVYSLQFDGKYIVSGSLDTSIRVWDACSGQLIHTLLGHQSLTSGMELKSNYLVSGNADSTVKIWDIVSGKCLHTLSGPSKHQSAVTSLHFNTKFVVTSSDDGSVKLWDMKTGEFIRDLVELESGGSGGVVWRVKCNEKKLVCAVGSRNGTEETKLLVLDFDVHDSC